jgi:hypothetical protein
MSIFKLKRREDWKNIDWDTTVLMIVRAPSEEKAREAASKRVGDGEKKDWLDVSKVSCEKVKATGPVEIIAREDKAG